MQGALTSMLGTGRSAVRASAALALAAALGRRRGPVGHAPAGPRSRPSPDRFTRIRTAPCDRGLVSTMRNPRALMVTQQLAVEHLGARNPPPADALFWGLWDGNVDVAALALHTPFIQGIAAGTLDPVVYGRYNVSDAYYCFHAADDYALAAQRARDTVLKAYLHAKHSSYRAYNETFPSMWHIRDASGIEPGEACREYSSFEREVVQKELPVYALVAMLPCEHLWPWLGTKIGPPSDRNLYRRWIEENSDLGGAYAIGNVLADYEKRHPGVLCAEKAHQIYRRAMTFEWQNFATA